MGMVVRTNTMAINAYRQLGMNNNAVAKSLEKLASGYRINRAGDDAAGLAISEKMKAQITGLETASANAQDGISLIQTAEGNLGEVHDMLNRMVELATKSANGTYTATEREALQAEVDQLLEEIDRISQSANFNGAKLLDGSLNAIAASTTANETKFQGLKNALADPSQADEINTDFDNAEQGWAIITHKDAVADAKTSFEIDMSNFKISGAGEGGTATVEMDLNDLQGATTTPDIDNPATPQANSGAVVDKDGANKVWSATVTADGDGNVDGKTIAKAMADALTDGKIFLKNSSGETIEYQVTADGNKLKFEMTDAGYATAAKAYVDDHTGSLKSNVFNGNFNVGIAVSNNATAVTSGLTDNSTSNIKVGTKAAGTRLADVLASPDDIHGWNKTDFKDGAGIRIGTTNYVFAGTDDTFNALYDSNTKVVDIRDIYDEKNKALKNDGLTDIALQRISAAAADNDMWSVQVNEGGNFLALREKVDYSGDADLTTYAGIKETLKLFDKAVASSTTTEATGKALTLQIGDTADDFNKMTISIADMSAKGLNLDGLKITSEAESSDAIARIKDAINSVSSTRAGLGALQNRLEHTINNLDVAAENLSAANSRIRDTDMAKEMMNYTKMNVLVQSAQAMLAQANQQPQSVLQLLQ